MSYAAPPKLIGRIVITSGSNDRLDWTEDDGITPVGLNTVIAAGTYYPTEILDALVSQMTAATVYGASYTYSVDNTTGIITITASGGTLSGWYPQLKTGESDKLLTGGDVAVETIGANHLGWYVDSVYPTATLSFSSDTHAAYQWYPSQPVQTDNSRSESVQSEHVSLGGKQYTYNYSGSTSLDATDYRHIREVAWTYLTDTDRSNYLSRFWLPYGQHGSRFRYYPDRTAIAYEEMHLTLDSLRTHAPDRVGGYPMYSWALQMRRYKA